MEEGNQSDQRTFGIGRSIGIVICVIGILAGLSVMGVGNDIFGAANRYDADFRTPLGASVSLAGLVILAIAAVGLISLIGSVYAKSTAARSTFNGIGAVALVITVVGAFMLGSFFLSIEMDARTTVRIEQEYLDSRLLLAEQGDVQAQVDVGDIYFRAYLCSEALDWYLRAAYQGEPDGQAGASKTYADCSRPIDGVPPDYISAYVWQNLAMESFIDSRGYKAILLTKPSAGYLQETEAGTIIRAEDQRVGYTANRRSGGGRGYWMFTAMGLKSNDLVTEIDGQPLTDLDQARELLQSLDNAYGDSVIVERNGETQVIVLGTNQSALHSVNKYAHRVVDRNAQAVADKMIDRAHEIFADVDLSAAERQAAIESAFHDLLPDMTTNEESQSDP